MRAYKVKLKLNNKQKTECYKIARACHFAYNWCLEKQQENYKQGNKFIKDIDIRREFTKFKQDNKWLYEIPNEALKDSIKNCNEAYIRFFNKKSKLPRFKSKKKSKLSFLQRYDTLKIIDDNHIKLSNLGIVKLYESDYIPKADKYLNPRISSDGIEWYISLSVEEEQSIKDFKQDGIGIDLGIKSLATLNDGTQFENINKTKRVKKIEKKLKRTQRAVSRKYLLNKQGKKYIKTQNILKQETKLKRQYQQLNNIRNDHINKIISNIIKREPSFVVLENLNVSGLMKNKHLSKAIAQCKFYTIRDKLENKLANTTSQLILADRFYPSSKICSHCGNIKKDLKLADRIYVCECGYEEDRDVNASKNLYEYGKTQIKLRKAS